MSQPFLFGLFFFFKTPTGVNYDMFRQLLGHIGPRTAVPLIKSTQ